MEKHLDIGSLTKELLEVLPECITVAGTVNFDPNPKHPGWARVRSEEEMTRIGLLFPDPDLSKPMVGLVLLRLNSQTTASYPVFSKQVRHVIPLDNPLEVAGKTVEKGQYIILVTETNTFIEIQATSKPVLFFVKVFPVENTIKQEWIKKE